MKYCIRLHERDNVATVLEPVEPGDELEILDARMNRVGMISAAEPIPYAHKIGLSDIPAQADVTKFGERIGRAVTRIPKGSYVHVHNVVSVEGSVQTASSGAQGEIR